jgi:hypothetical protein
MVFPYLKGLVIIKCDLLYLSLWIYCVFSIFCDYICISIQVPKKWYQSTFLGRHCGQIFFIFAGFFFRRGKRGPRHYINFLVHLCEKIAEPGYRSKFLS